MPRFLLAAVVCLSTVFAACADEAPPARSPDSPIGTSAEEAPPPVAPSFSGRATSEAPSATGAATDPHAGHQMPAATTTPTASPTSAPSAAPAPAHDHSTHSHGTTRGPK